jgi:flagellar basal body-associated protein FliL
MKKRKTIIGVIIAILIIFIVGGMGCYNYEMKKSGKAREVNDKWAEDYKHPWRHAEFHSKDDYFRLNQTIQNSYLSDEDKLKESINLWKRYYDWEQSQKPDMR